MSGAINFLLESVISLSVLVAIYVMLLKGETFFKLNRIFLLGSLVFSVVVPLLKIKIIESQPVLLTEVTVTPYRNVLEAVTIYGNDLSVSVEQTVLSFKAPIWIYFIGLGVFILLFVLRIIQISLLIKKHPVQKSAGVKLVLMNNECGIFSFLNYVFVNKDKIDTDDFEKIMAHEMEHIRQGHSFDVLMLEILVALQWFNPFAWMLRSAVKENHEYLADRAVLATGVSRGYYKKLLIDQFTGGQNLIANSFNYSSLKNRIKMMSKINSSKTASIKYLPGFLMAVILTLVFACEKKEVEVAEVNSRSEILNVTIVDDSTMRIEGNEEELKRVLKMMSGSKEFNVEVDSLGNIFIIKQQNIPKILDRDEQIFFIVEDMPEFPGGEAALRQFITTQVNYPKAAQENGIQGRVYVTFVIDTEGNVANARIARGVDPLLDMEALRVVNVLPKWKPGVQRGKPVNVSYTVPINFALQ